MDVLNIAKEWVLANPKHTALYAGSAAVVALPGIVTAPVLGVLGLTPAGPAAGSAISGLMGSVGSVAAGSPIAILQSAAMGGYGAPIVAGAVQAGAVAASAAGFVWGKVAGN